MRASCVDLSETILAHLLLPHNQVEPAASRRWEHSCQEKMMAKIAKTADRKKVMDTSKAPTVRSAANRPAS